MKFIVLTALLVVSTLGKPTLRQTGRPVPDGRIVGGNTIDISKVPWQISLRYYGNHICGGSVISEKFVVTAAHCTDGASASALRIRAGTSNRNSGGQEVSVYRIYQHPRYNSNTIDYDISILQLSSSLILNSNTAAVTLPSDGQTWSPGTSVLVTGWGTTFEDGSMLPTNLMGVTVQMVSNADCNRVYGSGSITTRMVCAGVSKGGKDSCQGDSGGPLVAGKVLVGIVSWGYGCARPEYPGVYSSVGNLRSYIKDATGQSNGLHQRRHWTLACYIIFVILVKNYSSKL